MYCVFIAHHRLQQIRAWKVIINIDDRGYKQCASWPAALSCILILNQNRSAISIHPGWWDYDEYYGQSIIFIVITTLALTGLTQLQTGANSIMAKTKPNFWTGSITFVSYCKPTKNKNTEGFHIYFLLAVLPTALEFWLICPEKRNSSSCPDYVLW